MINLLFFIFFALGLIIGSFLNVVICRMNTSRSLSGRSACMSCEAKLKWYELVPVLSFLGLGGRCRNCQTRISIQYPLVELATGFIFGLLFLNFQEYFFLAPYLFIISYAYYTAMFSLLVVIAVYDFKHKIVPNPPVFLFSFCAFLSLFLFAHYEFHPHIPEGQAFLSGLLIALPFLFFWLISRGTWMGLGDAKLALGLGWFLPFAQAISGITIAFWSGAAVGVLLIVLSREHQKFGMKSEIPFVPFMVFGAFFAFSYGLNLFGINF